MSARRRARVLAISALYQMDLLSRTPDQVIKEVRDGVSDQPEGLYYLEAAEQGPALDFFEVLIRGVAQHQDDLDRTIEDHLENWALDRLGRVEKAILRLGSYELLYRDDIPREVSLDEMVELSKSFCDAKSKDFVNGVLDAVAPKAT
jgi:N utilization substance protein B